MRAARLLIALALACASVLPGRAQAVIAPYKFDIGGSLGMSGYIGDANGSNPFKHPGFTFDLGARYILDTRWAFRAALSSMGLKGDTSEISDVLPSGEGPFSFTTTVWDLGVRCEFNFFNYGIGETYKRLRRWTPYLALGVGVSMASADDKTVVAPSLPMAFGFKYKPRERWNLWIEFSMTKVFSDKVDGIYEPNHIKTDFYKNTDWFSRLAVGISYEFGRRCETCHYVD